MIQIALLCSIVCSAAPTQHAALPRVMVIGVDGMTFDVLKPMLARHELPTLQRLIKNGQQATLLSERPIRSPALWATLATGQPRATHQIYDFVTGSHYWPTEQKSSTQQLVTSQMRKSPAIWQYLSRAQRSSIVVGWLNTWPAEAIRGAMVAPYVALGQNKQTSIKGKIYRAQGDQTYPPSLAKHVNRWIVTPQDIRASDLAQLADIPKPSSALYKAVPNLKRFIYTIKWSMASAYSNTNIVEKLLKRYPKTQLVMTYFDGTDTLAHRFWHLRNPVPAIQARLRAHNINPKHALELKQRFGRTIDNYYKVIDRLISRLLRAAGPNTTTFIVSDHGWGTWSKTANAPHNHVPFDGEHRLDGVFLADGPAIQAPQKNAARLTYTLYDIVPTSLYLLGIPVPHDLPGRITHEILEPQHPSIPPSTVIAKQRSQPSAPATPDKTTPAVPFAPAELERLRSLGYVQ